MNSSRPYLLRGIYEWLVDNALTPYLLVDATLDTVMVPEQHVDNGKIVLNISPQAVDGLSLANDCVEFDAYFGGVLHHIYVPIAAAEALYAQENGRGMVFNEDTLAGEQGDDSGSSGLTTGDAAGAKKKGPPHLKVIK